MDFEEKERLSSSLWVLGGGLWERNSGEPYDYENYPLSFMQYLFFPHACINCAFGAISPYDNWFTKVTNCHIFVY